MSDVEQRQTQQRAITIAACAAAFVAGGPLVAHRFDVQKSDEAYRAHAAQLGMLLASTQADWRHASGDTSNDGGLVQASLTNFAPSAAPAAATAVYASGFGDLQIIPARLRDVQAIKSFVSVDPRSFGAAEQQQSELDCLAKAVYYEARSESSRGQLAVAEVVMNRVRDSRYPNSICEVVFQGQYRQTGCQFTFTCDGSMRHKPRGAAWDRAKAVALHVQLGLNKPVTNNATHYHTNYVDPYWSAGLVTTNVVGTHIFYRFPETGSEWARARSALAAQEEHRATVYMLETEALAQESLRVFEADLETRPATPGVITISADTYETPPARGREL